PAQIDSRAGRGSYTDHKIAGGGGNLEGNFHGLVHREHLDRARTNSQKARERSRAEHQAKTGGNILYVVMASSTGFRKATVHFQSRRKGIWRQGAFLLRARLARQIRRVEKHDAKNNGNGAGWNARCEERPGKRPDRGGNFQKHPNPDVRKAFFYIS